MSEIILEDGTTCDPWIEDCPVPTDDTQFTLQVATAGRKAAIIYGVVSLLETILPPLYYAIVRRPNESSIAGNDRYKLTWSLTMLGHVLLYSFPALTWPMSLSASRPTFNAIYVMWQ